MALSSYSVATSRVDISTGHEPSIAQQDTGQPIAKELADDGSCDDDGSGANADGCCMASMSCAFCATIAEAGFQFSGRARGHAVPREVKLSSAIPEFAARPPRNS
jgi:hypothetical protein